MEEIRPPQFYWKAFAALLILLGLTWGLGYLDFGVFNLVIALGISFAKMILIALVFMQIRGGSRLLYLAAAAGLLWLTLMLVLTFADYLTR